MRMRINKARHNRFPCHVEHFRARQEPRPFGPTLLMRLSSITISAFFRTSSPFIVTTVAPRSTIVPFGVFPRNFEIDCDLLNVLVLFLEFLRFLFFVLLFILVGVRRLLSFLSPSFFSSSFGGSKEIALSGSRKKLAPTAQVIVFPSSAQLK